MKVLAWAWAVLLASTRITVRLALGRSWVSEPDQTGLGLAIVWFHEPKKLQDRHLGQPCDYTKTGKWSYESIGMGSLVGIHQNHNEIGSSQKLGVRVSLIRQD